MHCLNLCFVCSLIYVVPDNVCNCACSLRSELSNLKIDPAALQRSETTGKVKGVIVTAIGKHTLNGDNY